MSHLENSLRILGACVASLLLFVAPAFANDGPWTPEEAEQFGLGQEALRGSRFEEAITIFKSLEPAHPESGVLKRMLGHALASAGRPEEARDTLISAFSLGQMTSDVLARLVEIDHAAGRTGAVLASTRMLLLLEPDDTSWLRTYADLLLSAGQNAAADVAYRALMEKEGPDHEIYDRLGRIAYQDGDEREAVIAWETAYWIAPQPSAELAERISGLWSGMGDDERSLEWAERQQAVEVSDRSNLRRAELLFAMADYSGSTEAAQALSDSSDQTLVNRAQLLMGHCAYRSGDLEEAIRCWNECLASGVSSADLCGFAGRMCAEADQHQEAIRFLEQAVAAREDDAHLRSLLVRSLMADGELERAKSQLVSYFEFHGMDGLGERLLAEYIRSTEGA